MRMAKATLIFILFVAAFAACATPTPQTLTPMPAVQVVQVVATPNATPIVTVTPTTVPTPTAFSTAPAPGTAAVVPILMYHHIADLPSGASELQRTWTVAPKNFDAQMDWLVQHGFHSITMTQLVAYLKFQQPLPTKPMIISFDDGWEEQYLAAFPTLKKHGLIGTFFVYTNPVGRAQFITWAQLQEMSAAGMDIQAHSLSHPHLRALPPDEAFKEIAGSKEILERRLSKPVVAFDYPFGEYDNAVIEMVKRAGFESAVTLAGGYRQRADELFTLHRIRISYGDTLEDFAKRLP